MLRYQYDCVLADLVFSCPAPKQGEPVLLGCIEVDDCCVLRISNTHRRYVWSFANIVQVLMATVMAGALGSAKSDAKGERDPGRIHTDCCEDPMNFDAEAFLSEFEINPAGRYLAATAPIRAFQMLRKATSASFDFQDSAAISPDLFASANAKQVVELAAKLGIKATVAGAQEEVAPPSPFQALFAQGMLRRDDALRIFPAADGAVRAVTPEFGPTAAPGTAAASEIQLGEMLNVRDATIAELKTQLADLQQRVAKLEPAAAPPDATPPDAAPPAAKPPAAGKK
jgi:hypothetical protein